MGELEQELGVVGPDLDRLAQEGGGLGERGHAARLGRRGGEMRHGVLVAAGEAQVAAICAAGPASVSASSSCSAARRGSGRSS